MHIHFDDLLWVLTDSQVQSAMLCVKALRDMMERSNQQMRKHNLQNQETNAQVESIKYIQQDACIHIRLLLLAITYYNHVKTRKLKG